MVAYPIKGITFAYTKTINKMKTTITQFDRSKFEGFKFDFVLNGPFGKLLRITTTPQEAILEYVDFFGVEPTECKQVSKYPARN